MGRQHRVQYEGAWHHVFNRGACHQNVFHNPADRRTFLHLLDDATSRYSVQVHAYCLMGNHFHLILHTPQAGLSASMQVLLSRYTRDFNKSHGRDGPLFRSRFESTHVGDERYLAALTRYVHNNPEDLGWNDCAGYPWSSLGAYLGYRAKPNWLHVSSLFSYSNGPSGFRRMIDRVADAEAEEFLDRIRYVPPAAKWPEVG